MCHPVYDDEGNLIALVNLRRPDGPYDLEEYQEMIASLPSLVRALEAVAAREECVAPVVPIRRRARRRVGRRGPGSGPRT